MAQDFDFLTLSNYLADEAALIPRRYYRQTLDIINKEDDTPGTIADRAIEQRLREIVGHARPEDGIIGEEFGIKVHTFQHTLEGYKVAPEIKAHGANASIMPDWWCRAIS